MADFSFSDDRELQALNAQVLEDPEEFEHWEKLVRAAESQEGGLNRNSSPQAIAATRDTYDGFLARFPLFFGFWKKYADLEFSIGGTEAAEMVYERGIASIGISVDLWANYCAFKIETSHDADMIRELFERGAESVGLDPFAHPFWDKYLEYEERLESQDNIFAILGRVIHVPMHQYARYFERYQTLAQRQPVNKLVSEDILEQFRQDIERENGVKPLSAAELERDLRIRAQEHHLEIFRRTQTETTKRWTFESEIRRPYYHVTELDDQQLVNWRKYLDFEESEGDYARIKLLYERCLVTAANYDEFWFRYARWTKGQKGKSAETMNEELRNIYRRASCTFVPISQPAIRLYYARFEESLGKADTAIAIHEAILEHLPGHLETIVSLSSVHRRQNGVDSAVAILNTYSSSQACSPSTQGALVAELARLTWKVKDDVEGARSIYESRYESFLDARQFWISWLFFEMDQPTSATTEVAQHKRIKAVYEKIRNKSRLSAPVVKSLSSYYFVYLQERGGIDGMMEFMNLDTEINGPSSVAEGLKGKTVEDDIGDEADQRLAKENGHPGLEINEAIVRQSGN